jgi:hypothetical protein
LALGAACLILVAVYLLRPAEDQLAAIRRFDPDMTRYATADGYDFSVDPDTVLASIPGTRRVQPIHPDWATPGNVILIKLPSGAEVEFYSSPNPVSQRDGVTCTLLVPVEPQPWYHGAWRDLRHRLGLDKDDARL